jgi:methyl-accepting chemotaxis protein
MGARTFQFSRGTLNLASTAKGVLFFLKHYGINIQQNSDHSKQAENAAEKAAADAEEGRYAVTMIVDSIKQIYDKTSLIQGISKQTNLLALNTSMEVVTVDKKSKSFAEAALRMGKLAISSRKAAVEITELANTSIKITNNAEEVLIKLLPEIRKTMDLVKAIIVANKKQELITEQLKDILLLTEPVIQQNIRSAKDMISSVEGIFHQVNQLKNSIDQFFIEAERRKIKN